MRRSLFGDAYVDNTQDALAELVRLDLEPDMVFARAVETDAGEKPTVEIVRNDDGETALNIECDTMPEAEKIVTELKIEWY